MSNFDKTNQLFGRQKITTNRKITGNAEQDVVTIKKILKECLPKHEKNVKQQTELFHIFFNDANCWQKTKVQREDINNKISVPSAYAITRTLNGYCFSEPIKYIARNSEGGIEKQKNIETLSSMLDFAHNHDSTTMATLCSSICGVGYKLVLPSTNEEYDETGVPFVINDNFIYPQLAFVVVSDEVIPRDVLGVMIGTYYNKDNEPDGKLYTCWTKYHQFLLKEDNSDLGFAIEKQTSIDGNKYDYYPLMTKRIPLVEVERNAFRKGDWEVAKDLLILKNQLMSNRADDVEQVVDYILVLLNCKFENANDRDTALKSRLFELQTTDPQNKPAIEVLKNALDQNGVQIYADYIDKIIQECIGVPSRQERGYGGGDTGTAVQYRNGFRDLENNASIIVPKMDKAELKFLALCIAYCKNRKENSIGELKPFDIRCKFNRSLTDDIVSSSQAFLNYINGGLSFVDSLILSKSGTDPSEIAEKAKKAIENGETLVQKAVKESEETTKPAETLQEPIANNTNSQNNVVETLNTAN